MRLFPWAAAALLLAGACSLTAAPVERFAIDRLHAVAWSAGGAVLAGGRGALFRAEAPGQGWLQVAGGRDYLQVVAAGGALYAGGRGQGVRVSRDGGRRWQAAGPLPAPDVHALAVLGRQVLAFVAGHGLFGSADGGATWFRVGDGPEPAILALAFSPAEPGLVWAGGAGGLYVSRDGGKSWAPGPVRVRPVLGVAVSADGHTVAAARASWGISRDGGKTWGAGPATGLSTVVALAFREGSSAELVAGAVDGGVAVSADGGRTWQRIN